MGTSDGSELEELGSGGTGSSLVSGSRVVMVNEEVKVTRGSESNTNPAFYIKHHLGF